MRDAPVRSGSNDWKYITRAVSSARIPGDGRENLIVYTQWQPGIGIWGLSAVDSIGFAELSTLNVTSRFNTQDRVEPIVLPVTADGDRHGLVAIPQRATFLGGPDRQYQRIAEETAATLESMRPPDGYLDAPWANARTPLHQRVHSSAARDRVCLVGRVTFSFAVL